MAAWLHELADSVEQNNVDAVLVVITSGDVHKVEGRGHYADGTAYYNAVNAPEKMRFGQIIKRRYDPIQEAAERERRALQAAAAAEAERLAKPFVCRCKYRFATAKGHAQHARIRVRTTVNRQGGTDPEAHTLAEIYSMGKE